MSQPRICALLLLLSAWMPSGFDGAARLASADEILVNSTDDDGVDANPGNEVCETIPGNGKCTLRAAVMEANGNPGPDTIRLAAGALYVLTRANPIGPDQDLVGAGGDLDLVNDDVTIIGNGATIDGNATERVFHVAGNIAANISDLTIRNGRDVNGGGVFAQGQLTLTRCTITNSASTGLGGGVYVAGGVVTFNNCTIVGNQSGGHGGGVYVANGALTLNNCTVSDNRAPGTTREGGGLYVAAGSAALNDSFVLRNVAYTQAGGLLNRATSTLRRTTVSGNTAVFPGYGIAGIRNNGGTLTIEDSSIRENEAGGVANLQPGILTIRRSIIHGNTFGGFTGGGLNNEPGATATLETTTVSGHTNSGGAGIWNMGVLTIRANSVIRDNVANSGTGGSGIYNAGSQANVQISDSTIIGNRTTSGNFPEAAAILNKSGARMTITNSVIAENVGGNFGGGVHNAYNAGAVTISGCTIRDNRVLSQFASGVGVFTQNNCTITDTLFIGNVTAGLNRRGGGLFNDTSGTLTLRDCTFVNNQATSGAALVTQKTAVIERCAFHGNIPGFEGGTIVTQGLTTTIKNCTISGNLGNQGGGLNANPGTLNLTNVTIANNTGRGLDISGAAGTVVNLQNTIVAGNTGQDCARFGPLTTLGNNIDSDGTCGLTDPADLPNTDPMLGPLAANGGLSLTHRMLFGSPAIDAANDAACPNHDQRFASRPADGDNDGVSHCDIGAYEQQFADCDNNDVFDLIDIQEGTWPDADNNGVPDICEVPGDIDGNGVVDLDDYARFPRCFDGPDSPAVSICIRADADGDGDVDLADFAATQNVFGRSMP